MKNKLPPTVELNIKMSNYVTDYQDCNQSNGTAGNKRVGWKYASVNDDSTKDKYCLFSEGQSPLFNWQGQ